MKRNSDKDKVDKNLVDYITDVRKNIDCPKIYIPYVETNIKGIYGIHNTFNEWVNDVFGFTNVSIKIKLKEGCSDEEKRNVIKEAVCRFIDIALDEYEVRKEEEGLNKLAKVDRSKEVEEAKKRLEKNKCIIDLGKEIYDSYFEDGYEYFVPAEERVYVRCNSDASYEALKNFVNQSSKYHNFVEYEHEIPRKKAFETIFTSNESLIDNIKDNNLTLIEEKKL